MLRRKLQFPTEDPMGKPTGAKRVTDALLVNKDRIREQKTARRMAPEEAAIYLGQADKANDDRAALKIGKLSIAAATGRTGEGLGPAPTPDPVPPATPEPDPAPPVDPEPAEDPVPPATPEPDPVPPATPEPDPVPPVDPEPTEDPKPDTQDTAPADEGAASGAAPDSGADDLCS
jgi:outer membrane biosynthesis protein TonB